MLAKILASTFALGLSLFVTKQFLLQATFIGILPIWFEVIASTLTKVEPARENRRSFLIADALIDISVFLLIPSAWFAWNRPQHPLHLVCLGVFVFCGIWRIHRFLKIGLDHTGSFQGLPVTYTGYLWPVLFLISENIPSGQIVSGMLLLATSYAMISSRLRIKASR